MEAPSAEPRDLRRVNDMIWESLAAGGRTESVAFLCECDDASCYQAVWLTLDDYAEARSRPGWTALSAHHQLTVQ